MKAVILAGGLGTRISEETVLRPKPMVEIGGRPVLWHIMKLFSAHGVDEFVICLGYRGYMIKEYFANYYLHSSDVTFDIAGNDMEVHQESAEPWRVTLIDTGEETATGGRLKRVLRYLGDDDFFFTYGDGVTDLDLRALLEYHRAHDALATVTAVQPPGRFGALDIEGDVIRSFHEKPRGDGAWVNGGFFVLSPAVGDYIEGDGSVWEEEPVERLAQDGQLRAYRYDGFWRAMDTVRDRNVLEELWRSGGAPWKVWS
ncbi:MAG: glucose-phosphate cytidylyltransferase [Thermoleophilaceae bacterium]|jgi:glucose-1-phosphate cytidylyltransferase|nr:glucose-phosphate cytidylyltransferase [Thermoleophilaceae bacterium]